MLWCVALLPFILQSIAILLDEGIFHIKRGLPKWERIGHPLDTLSFLACFLFVLFVPFSTFAFVIYTVLACFSCLMVTKDEFIHKECCPAAEHWLHAILFILHPITLAMTAAMWPIKDGTALPEWVMPLFNERELLSSFLYMQAGAMTLFLVYQVVFWNMIWREKPVGRYDQQ